MHFGPPWRAFPEFSRVGVQVPHSQNRSFSVLICLGGRRMVITEAQSTAEAYRDVATGYNDKR